MTKLALLTGGAGGIGGATAALLRARGWDVEAPTRAELDMDAEFSVMGWVYLHDTKSKPQALIFCHGRWFSQAHHSPYDIGRQVALRVSNPLYLMTMHGQLATGCVVMVASTQAFGGRNETGPYGVACAGQVRLIQGLAQAKDGVRYNCVCPGLTDTPMAAQVRASGDCKPDAVAQPARAVAAAIVGLIESDANGKILRVVDGVTTEAKWSW